MSYSPVAFIAPNYRDFKRYWFKAYEPATTTAKTIALDSAGVTTVAKLELDADGFFVSAGGAVVMPYVSGDYDAYLFPTEVDADANNTAEAVRVADNLSSVSAIGTSYFDNVEDMKAANLSPGERVNLDRYRAGGELVSGLEYVVTTGAADGFVDHTLSNGNVAKLVRGDRLIVTQAGAYSGKPDNFSEIQAAVDLATTEFGGGVYFPKGTFSYSQTIVLGFNSFIVGTGYSTFIRPVGCTGFDLPASGIPSGRGVFREFYLWGDNTVGTVGFNSTVSDSGLSQAIKGLHFESVFVQGFEEGWRMIGLWNALLHHCETTGVHRAVNMLGRNIGVIIDSCNFVGTGTYAGATGNSAGIHQATSGGLKAESLLISKTTSFGFNFGIRLAGILYSRIEGCTLDFCTGTCLELVVNEGGCSVTGNWMYTQGNSGIVLVSVGTAIKDNTSIRDNYILKDSPSVDSGVVGITVNANQENVLIDGNCITNFGTATSILEGKIKYTNNSDLNTGVASLRLSEFAPRCFISGNIFNSPIVPHPNSNPLYGKNDGALTQECYAVAFSAGVLSETFTYSSLGLPDQIPNTAYFHQATPQGTAAQGGIGINSTATGITLYRQTVLGSPVGIYITTQAT